MKIDNRQQFLVVLTIAVAALLIANSFIYEPLANQWTKRSGQIMQLRKKVDEGNMLKKRDADLRKQWDNMRAVTLPPNPSAGEQQVVNALVNWSRNTGAELPSITPQIKNDSTNYMTISCRIEAGGTLSALSQFIYNVEQGQLALKLDSAEFSAHDPKGQQLTLGLQISGLALLQQQTPTPTNK